MPNRMTIWSLCTRPDYIVHLSQQDMEVKQLVVNGIEYRVVLWREAPYQKKGKLFLKTLNLDLRLKGSYYL